MSNGIEPQVTARSAGFSVLGKGAGYGFFNGFCSGAEHGLEQEINYNSCSKLCSRNNNVFEQTIGYGIE
jgi:hypothetical protein